MDGCESVIARGSDDAAALSDSVHATCNMMPLARLHSTGARLEDTLQLAHGMVSARSRYQHRRPVIRRAISSLCSLPRLPSYRSACCCVRCVALRCVALLLAVPTRTCQPSSASPATKATTTYRPACHPPPAVAHGTYLPRRSGAAAQQAPAADSLVSSARATNC